mmetsp:Transcript_13180/g.31210  ORF Transcript_13180/g.31210 Transcript_13180/m.31210 type:complete len:250 (-) Transcript_13180:415-1164(-)
MNVEQPTQDESSSAKSYTEKSYWDFRYASDSSLPATGDVPPFDWLCEPKEVSDLLQGINLNRKNVVFVEFGCGESAVSDYLFGSYPQSGNSLRSSLSPLAGISLGFDFSDSGVLEKVRKRHLSIALHTEHSIADVRRVPLRSSVADVVFDKGCLDSVLQDFDQAQISLRWKRRTLSQVQHILEKGKRNAVALLSEASRLLTAGGVFVLVSYEDPARRLSFLDQRNLGWTVAKKGAEDTKGNYIYVCRKT